MQKKTLLYSICKNEEKNILSWFQNFQDVDIIVVVDTGSTDSSISLLTQCKEKHKNMYVYQLPYEFYSFADARNFALNCARSEMRKYSNFDSFQWIFMCFDFDERLAENGLEIIKKEFDESKKIFSICRFYGEPSEYDLEVFKNREEGLQYHPSRIHSSDERWYWRDWVHEELDYKNLQSIIAPGITSPFIFSTYYVHLPVPEDLSNEKKENYKRILRNWKERDPDDTTPRIHYLEILAAEFPKYDLDSSRVSTMSEIERLVFEMEEISLRHPEDPYKLSDALEGLEKIISINSWWVKRPLKEIGLRQRQIKLIENNYSKKYRTPYIKLAKNYIDQAIQLIQQGLELSLNGVACRPFSEDISCLENKRLYKRLLYLSLSNEDLEAASQYKALSGLFPNMEIEN